MEPSLTAGLIAGELRRRAESSLQHLLAQTALDRMEILVVDLSPNPGRIAGTDHPRVRYLARPQLHYYCEAQAELASEARAPLIAFVEDHCYAVPGWAEAVLNAFENPRVAAVNYTFTNARDNGYVSRSILMAEYGHWMTPHPGGPVRISSSTNVAYRTGLLRKFIRGNQGIFETEFLVHRALQESGGEIHVAPAATVAHESWASVWEACLANGANKRVLGARRVENGRWGLPLRIAWAAGMLLVPALSLARLAWVLRNRPALWGTLLAGLPVIVAIDSYSAWCEALGYLSGAGASREEFRARELAVQRDE